jgi:hypothetical protein
VESAEQRWQKSRGPGRRTHRMASSRSACRRATRSGWLTESLTKSPDGINPALTFQYGLCMGQDGNEVITTKKRGRVRRWKLGHWEST